MEFLNIKFDNEKKEEKDKFLGNMDSILNVDICKNEIMENDEWIEEILFTIPYIEKALNNPNKNIVTEEEIVKIELIKKVTVESIKHLSKHTDLISDYDKETGDVIPSKILNAFKEENFITYENRFIYTLIKLIEDFITIRIRKREEKTNQKNFEKVDYEATTKIGDERIKMNFTYSNEYMSQRGEEEKVNKKIKEIQENLKNFKMYDIYKLLEEKRAPLVQTPLKMTNVLLKNVNFQYAVKLYNYLLNQFGLKNKINTINKKYQEKGKFKYYIDENFYMQHILLQQLKNEKTENKKNINALKDDLELRKKITDRYITRIIQINPELAEEEIKEMVVKKFIKINENKKISLKPIEKIFKTKMKEYLTKVEKVRFK